MRSSCCRRGDADASTRVSAHLSVRTMRSQRADWMAAHTRSAVQGMSMWVTPRCDTASTTAFWIAGVDPIVPDSPMPLAPSGLRGLSVSVFDVSKLHSSAADGHGVVHQVRGDRVAVLVVLDLLVQRLRSTLGDATVLLAAHEQRIENAAAVVDGHVAEHRHRDRSRCRPRRPRRGHRTGTSSPVPSKSSSCRSAPGLDPVGQLGRVLRRRGEIGPRHAVRRAHRPPAGRRRRRRCRRRDGLEQVGGDLLGPLEHPFGREVDRAAGRLQRP